MRPKNILKGVYFTPIQIKCGEIRASKLGMTFNDWVKYIVNKEIESLAESEEEWLDYEYNNRFKANTSEDEAIDPDKLPY